MGKASRRKRERHAAGYNKRTLQSLRTLIKVARENGGMIRLAYGTDGVNVHHVLLHALRKPETLCALEPDEIMPTNEDEVTCVLCAALTRRELQNVQWDVAAANMAATAEAKETLRRYGG